MNDYSKLTDTELRIEIAKRLGYSALEFDRYADQWWAMTADHKMALCEWQASVDACLTLPLYDRWFWTLQPVRTHGEASALLVGGNWERIEADAPNGNLARAMCEAWLQYMDARDGAK